ncbi:hypothetical protein WR25_21292 [Diploscapter pachys]|uniref:G-protein coupled receptors family 1 profile domain-containing protein n=1 Tax=Diploscapter pachys TaxID=2018661 RepID=A0A2A2LH67_9BILA|nr:hypothetical protein WR25_21292 [Diploscapter pachys]
MSNLPMNEAGNEIKGHETFHILQTSFFGWEHTKGFFLTSFIRRTRYASAIGCLYPSAFAMSLVLIAVHFIYRYFAICRPLYHEYGIDVDDTDLMATMYFTKTPDGLVPRWKDLAVCINMLFLIAIILAIIIFFCIKIQTALRNNIVMSAKTRRLQMQLFKALFYQVGNLHKNIKRKDS